MLAEEDRVAAGSAAADTSTRSTSARRVFLFSFVSFLLIFGAWAVATPPFAAPDEKYHISRASSVVRGDIGSLANSNYGGGAGTAIQPRGIGTASIEWRCLNKALNRNGTCAKSTPADAKVLVVFSGAARYNPVYYAAVGWPTLAIFDGGVVVPMRLISAAWCALLMAAALLTAIQFGRHRWLSVGVVAAATPQLAFLAGTVNPNSVEIAGAVLAWTAGLAVVTADPGRLTAAWMRRFALGATSLVVMRTLSPLWLAGILAALLVVAAPGQLRRLRQQRAVLGWLVVPLVGTYLALLWTFGAGTSEIPFGANRNPPVGFTLPEVLSRQPVRWQQYFGYFGLLNVPLSLWIVSVWAAIWLGLAGYAFARTTTRGRWALGLVTLGILSVPVLLEWPLTHRLGFYWQGRYALPIAVGLPLLAAACLSQRPGHIRPPRRAVTLVVLLCGAMGLFALTRTFMRYSAGIRHLSIFGPWQPPVPFLLLALGFVVAMALLAWSIDSTVRDPEPVSELAPAQR